jgi:hypothetical protein
MLRNLHQSLCRTLVEGQRIIRPDHGDESAMVQSVFGSKKQLPGLDDSRECLCQAAPSGGPVLRVTAEGVPALSAIRTIVTCNGSP